MAKRTVTIELLRCPHGQHAIAFLVPGGEGGSYRITSGKHCGRWVTVKKWVHDSDELTKIVDKYSTTAEVSGD